MYTARANIPRPIASRRYGVPVVPATPNLDQTRIRVTFLGLIMFVAGLGAAWKINLVGEIYVAELMLLLLMIVALPMGLPKLRGNRVFVAIVTASALTMVGYIASDLIRGTSEAQYLRGWARNAMVISSVIVLAALAAKDKRTLWWFVLGMALGSIAWFELVQNLPMRSPQYWKFNYATYVTLIVACSAAFLPRKIVAGLFVVLGIFSVTKDFRIHGTICVLTGALVWFVGAADPRKALLTIIKLGVVALFGILAAIMLVSLTKDDHTDQRRATSNVGRLLGIQVGLAAIANSPVIGYGSWPTDPELLRISREVTQSYEAQLGRPLVDGTITNAHSQILNAWMEGGFLGAALYLVVLFLLAWGGYYGLVRRAPDLFTPLIAFLFITQVWNLAMSPLGSSGRLLFAFSVALVVMIASERQFTRLGHGARKRDGSAGARFSSK